MLSHITALFAFVHSVLSSLCRLVWLFGCLLATLIGSLSDALVIFHEEFSHFGQDLCDIVSRLNELFTRCVANALEASLYVADILFELLSTGHICVDKLPERMLVVLTIGRDSLREFIQLIGNSVWLLLTFVPNLLLFLGRSVTILTRTTATAVWDFFREMPAESRLGFALFVILLALHSFTIPLAMCAGRVVLRRLIVPARSALSNYVYQQIAICRAEAERVLNWRPRLPTLRWWMKARPDNTTIEHDEASVAAKPTAFGIDTVCVVCADRPKTVVLLPCRHMCLCEECLQSLDRFYGLCCPLCRQPAERSLRVFT